ncbi:MAG: hypothetical protein GXO83_11080 [Chlorobi bacterium]|nr:hypothetical protein [Chlorobiota bacterium]
MKIKKFEFVLLADNEEIGKMSGTDKILIKAMSDSTYAFPVIIDYEPSVSREIKTLIRLFRDGSISILVNGKISGCAGIFPFRRKIHQEAILRFKKQTNEF